MATKLPENCRKVLVLLSDLTSKLRKNFVGPSSICAVTRFKPCFLKTQENNRLIFCIYFWDIDCIF